MSTGEKTVVSGVKPTGIPHLGNYFGAMRQFVELQEKYQNGYFFVADYHGLNSVQDGAKMSELIIELVSTYLAIGIDPEKMVIFKQSDVPAHTELCWIFNTITTMPYLMRAHAFKDAEAKNREISVGTFVYPLLMAADILLYDADVVPVGQDQKQHIEYARDTAQKFNNTYNTEIFKLPEPHILDSVATVPGIDGQKMSKSYGNTISLFATREELEKRVMEIVTNSTPKGSPLDPDNDTLFAIYTLVATPEDIEKLRARYLEGSIGYKEAKEMLIEALDAFIKPMREKKAEISKDRVADILALGATKARAVSEEKMRAVRRAIGVSL